MPGHDRLLEMECTLFFEQNPYAYETVQSLASRLGRKSEDLVPVLGRLLQLSILEQIGSGELSVYKYNLPLMMSEVELP